MSVIAEPRKQQVAALLEKFRQGEKPSTIETGASRNTIYFWYKIHCAIECQAEISKLLVTKHVKRLSQKDWDRILLALKSGRLD